MRLRIASFAAVDAVRVCTGWCLQDTSHIIGLPEDESTSVLEQLFAHSIRADNVYTHHWRASDMPLWDNRSSIYFAPGCPDKYQRTLHRTTIEGDVLV
ncbi:hypothetical protein UB44_15095 [Burkholderiaceae bacterium 26]|nr:hypothetical protein UB44_15095 [Burkholderiaceae bacterium 26]